jgi:hypothetical protein
VRPWNFSGELSSLSPTLETHSSKAKPSAKPEGERTTELNLEVFKFYCFSEDSAAQWIRRWSTEPEILGLIPRRVDSSTFFPT